MGIALAKISMNSHQSHGNPTIGVEKMNRGKHADRRHHGIGSRDTASCSGPLIELAAKPIRNGDGARSNRNGSHAAVGER